MSDIEKIVTKAVKGDSSAYTHLYKLARTQVYFTCLGILKNAADAEDIMQETFFTAAVKLPSLSDRNSFQAWVNRIAVNKCKNYLVKKKPDLYNDSNEETENELPDEEITLPDEYIENKVKRKIIMDIIMDKLSDLQRQAVIMYYFDEMNLAEIAAEMNCPEGTVKSRLSSARKIIEKEILRYEKINQDRLHTVLPIPFLTQLLRAEAESISKISKLDFSFISASAANAAQVTASSGEAVHSATSRIIAGITAVVLGGSVAGGVAVHEINKREMQAQAGYGYYELLDEEYQNSKYKNQFNDTIYWNGEELYFEGLSTSDYFRYNANTKTLDIIIPEIQNVSLDVDGETVDCKIVTTYRTNYCFEGNIYSLACLNFDESDTEAECALIKYDMDGNLEDYFILDDFYHGYDTMERYEQNAIHGITEDGRIYMCHVEMQFPNEYVPGTVVKSKYCRINTDFTDYETDLNFTNNKDGYYCSDIVYCNGRLYAGCTMEGNVYPLESVYYAYDEETLELIEDDFFIQNDIAPSYSIGKYMVTDYGIYDSETNELFVDLPGLLDNTAIFQYYGGDFHYCISKEGENSCEIKRVKLLSDMDYEGAGIELLDSLEQDEIVRKEEYIQYFEIIDSDTYLLYGPANTFFCRFSTGEKTKIIFPWSDNGQE